MLTLSLVLPRQLVEEAQAERDLFYSQRKKKIDATMSTNRREISWFRSRSVYSSVLTVGRFSAPRRAFV